METAAEPPPASAEPPPASAAADSTTESTEASSPVAAVEEERGVDCIVCHEKVRSWEGRCWVCCGIESCEECASILESTASLSNHAEVMSDRCPHCRQPHPRGAKAYVKKLRFWVEREKAWAQRLMGIAHLDGTAPYDTAAAARFFSLAAKQGDEVAMTNLAGQYIQGNGVTKDVKEAERLFKTAAQQGFPAAAYELALHLCEDHSEEERRWLKMAAKQGHPRAQFALADRLLKERDAGNLRSTPSTVEATFWMRAASDNGLEDARSELRELSKMCASCLTCAHQHGPVAAAAATAPAAASAASPPRPTARPSENFLRCAGCKSVYYCSSDCQKQHWLTHKAACKAVRKLEKSDECQGWLQRDLSRNLKIRKPDADSQARVRAAQEYLERVRRGA